MKKSLFAVAVLGSIVSAAQAQTSITVYGSIDAGLREQDNAGTTAGTAGASKLTLSSTGTYYSNRLGFKGVEDLGGGMNAHFLLESGFNSGTAALADSSRFFNRSALVGISGTWGTVDLGRQYSVAFKAVGLYDPFNYKFPTIIPTSQANVSAGTRFDNDLQYTGILGPVTFRVEHALGEVAGSQSAGSANAVGFSYESGPLALATAFTWRKMGPTSVGVAGGSLGVPSTNVVVSSIASGTFEDNKHWTVGGAYKFGAFRVAAGYADEKQNNSFGAVDTRIKNAWFGGSYDFTSAMGVTAAWYQTKTTGPRTAVSPSGFDGKKDIFIVGLTYALSKRTNFYADVDTAKFGGSAVGSATLGGTATNPGTTPFGQERTSGVSVGISHLF
jgi:predicted porin